MKLAHFHLAALVSYLMSAADRHHSVLGHLNRTESLLTVKKQTPVLFLLCQVKTSAVKMIH